MQLGEILPAGRQPALLRGLLAHTVCICALLWQLRLRTLGVPSGEGHSSLCHKWGFNWRSVAERFTSCTPCGWAAPTKQVVCKGIPA